MPTFNQALRDGYNLQLVITQTSQNISANTSTISGVLRIQRPSGQADYTSYQTVWSTGINGVNASGTTAGYNFANYSTLTLRSWTQTITHNSDGTKSFAAAGAWRETDPDPQVGYTTARDAAGTVTLTTIPRKSNPTMSASAVDAGDPITILTHRASASFTHTITYKIGSLSGTIATKTSVADVPWTPPLSLLNAIPNSTSGTVTITVETFSGSTSLGSATTSFTLRAPSEIVPTISSISHSEAVSSVSTNIGAYVKNMTKLNLTINGEAGVYGSTIASRKITVAGQTINADSGTTAVINASGTVPIVATVTDSRGRSKSLTQNVTVLDYSNPAITVLTVRRSTVAGVVDPNGTTIRVDFTASTKSLVNGTEKNNLTYEIWSREHNVGSYVLKTGPTTPSTTTSSGRLNFTGMVLLNTYAIEDSWDIQLRVKDKLVTSTTNLTATVSTAAIDVHFDANLGVGIGKFRENGRLDVAGDIYMSDTKVSVVGHVHSGADITTGTVPAARLPAASDTEAGIVERATQAEVNTGTDNSRYVTPATLRGNENLPSEAAWGHANYTSNINNGSGATVSVTFPSGRFTGVPHVVASVSSSARLNIAVLSITSTGFSFRLDNWSGAVASPNGADWIAMR